VVVDDVILLDEVFAMGSALQRAMVGGWVVGLFACRWLIFLVDGSGYPYLLIFFFVSVFSAL
jgi:hypothetical protein